MLSSYPNPKKFLQKEVEVENPKEKTPSLVYSIKDKLPVAVLDSIN